MNWTPTKQGKSCQEPWGATRRFRGLCGQTPGPQRPTRGRAHGLTALWRRRTESGCERDEDGVAGGSYTRGSQICETASDPHLAPGVVPHEGDAESRAERWLAAAEARGSHSACGPQDEAGRSLHTLSFPPKSDYPKTKNSDSPP